MGNQPRNDPNTATSSSASQKYGTAASTVVAGTSESSQLLRRHPATTPRTVPTSTEIRVARPTRAIVHGSEVAIIATSLPWTMALVGLATLISVLVGTVLGVVAGWRRSNWLDSLVPATTVLAAVPYFWLALLLVAVFGSFLGWFPMLGGYDVTLDQGWNGPFLGSALYYGVLPAVTIVISSAGGWLLGTRNMMVSVAA